MIVEEEQLYAVPREEHDLSTLQKLHKEVE